MAFYDKNRLLEEATSMMLVEFLGIDHEIKGSYTYIKCPGHLKRVGKVDNNFGNCILTEKGYHCFACKGGTTVGLIDMVQELQDCEYVEALEVIGDALGGRKNYRISGDEISTFEVNKTLSQSDFELLGLSSSVSIDEIQFISNDKKYIVENDCIPKGTPNIEDIETYLATTRKTYSLRTLKIDAPEVYHTLIKRKAKEAMEKYQFMMDVVCDRTSKESAILLPLCEKTDLEDEVLYDFKHIFMDMYNRCKEIYMEIDDDMCGKIIQEIEEDIKIPNYNLFD